MSAHAANNAQIAADKLRPKGPVTVTADRAELDKSGVMVYLGTVQLVSDTLLLKGDRLELRQYPGGQYEAKLKGTLAHMEQSGDVDEKGQPLPPMIAEGADMLYDTRTGMLDITGQAKATRGKNEVNGNAIRYNVNERRIQASGGQGGQVKIVIQPPPSTEKKQPSAKPLKPAEKKLPEPVKPLTGQPQTPAPVPAAKTLPPTPFSNQNSALTPPQVANTPVPAENSSAPAPSSTPPAGPTP